MTCFDPHPHLNGVEGRRAFKLLKPGWSESHSPIPKVRRLVNVKYDSPALRNAPFYG